MTWEGPPGKLNGELQGYMVEYSTPATQQVSLEWQTKAGQKHQMDWSWKDTFILTSLFISADSFRWTLDWTLSCQSTCPCRYPMCPSEFVPIPGRGGDPGPPHRLWLSSVLVSGKPFMSIQQIKMIVDIVRIKDEEKNTFSLFPQKWRNLEVSHFFFFLLSNSLCCDL